MCELIPIFCAVWALIIYVLAMYSTCVQKKCQRISGSRECEWEGSAGNSTWESQANSLIAPWKRRLLIVR